MKQIYTLNFTFLFILLLTIHMLPQGTLKGTITDSITGGPLIGANVYLVGTSFGAATNIEGKYSIHSLPAGNYRVRVSYIGYKTEDRNITVRRSEVTELDVRLIMDMVISEEVVITGQMKGQVSAINQQRSSNTIINVVSEEKIQELPDVNAAEVIGRMPGVSILRSGGEANKIVLRGLSDKYVKVTIDGIGIPPTDASARGLDLGTISQGSLAGIELYKALTPDKDADAMAGSVNLVTKSAPSERSIKVDMKGGYNNLMNSLGQYNFGLKYGERFLDELIGIQVIGNLERRIRSSERINLDYDQSVKNQTDYLISNFLVQFTDEIRERNGATLLFDFYTPDDGQIKLSAVYSSTERNYLTHERDYPSRESGSSVTYDFRDRKQDINTFNSSVTGNNNLFDFKFNWGASFAQSASKYPFDYYLEFLEPSITGAGMKNSPAIKTNPEQLVQYAYNNFRAATLYEAYEYSQNNFDKERTLFLNVSRPYVIDNLISGEIKFGGKYKSKSRHNNNGSKYAPYYLGYWQPYERMGDGTIKQKQFAGTYFDAFYQRYQATPTNTTPSFSEFLESNPGARELFDQYRLYPLIHRDRLQQWYNLNIRGISQNGDKLEYSNDPSVKARDYNITETVTAYYLMNTLNIGQFATLIAGVRVEREENNYFSKYSPVQTGGFPIPADLSRDTSASYQETEWLPNFHLNLKPIENFNIRVAAYKALARPDFNYRLNTYFAWRGAAVGSNKELIVGNPLLKTAQSWNYEINTSLYGNEFGLISLSGFYKVIKDQYHQLNQINTTGDTLLKYLGLKWTSLHTGAYQLTVPYNSPKDTKVWGFEFEHQMNFVFLPGYLKNIVLSYNVSVVKSETVILSAVTDTIVYYLNEFPGIPFYRYQDRPVEMKQQLEEQPHFFGNISLGYDIKGFSGRISVFHQSEYNKFFTASRRGDQVANSFTRIDLALKQKITDYLAVMLNVSNINNVKEGNSIFNRVNGYKIPDVTEYYGTTADLGVILEL